jgi:ribosomal protein S26
MVELMVSISYWWLVCKIQENLHLYNNLFEHLKEGSLYFQYKITKTSNNKTFFSTQPYPLHNIYKINNED